MFHAPKHPKLGPSGGNAAVSLSEIERFAADLKSNGALRAEAEKAQADKSHEATLARAVAFAASKGYAFTVDEAKAHAKATAKTSGKELSDAELDGVAGGDYYYCYHGPDGDKRR
jgi:hypothetical protein